MIDEHGLRPLRHFAKGECARLLLERGASAGAIVPFHRACFDYATERAHRLLEKGVPLEGCNVQEKIVTIPAKFGWVRREPLAGPGRNLDGVHYIQTKVPCARTAHPPARG
eukprot:scaffold25683_cov37-Tisochrysis_lutea.AAC.1